MCSSRCKGRLLKSSLFRRIDLNNAFLIDPSKSKQAMLNVLINFLACFRLIQMGSYRQTREVGKQISCLALPSVTELGQQAVHDGSRCCCLCFVPKFAFWTSLQAVPPSCKFQCKQKLFKIEKKKKWMLRHQDLALACVFKKVNDRIIAICSTAVCISQFHAFPVVGPVLLSFLSVHNG